MKYKVRKTLFGRLDIELTCPSCGDTVVHPISDAGTSQRCPGCATEYLCPGEEDRLRSEEAARRVQAEAKKVYEERNAANATDSEHEGSGVKQSDGIGENVREINWADRTTWNVFRWLRYGFAAQILLGYACIGAGAIALPLALCLLVFPRWQRGLDVGPGELAVSGIAAILGGYSICTTAALAAVLLHIERNTRNMIFNHST